MTRKERDFVVQELLSRYNGVGRTIVGDEHCLGRLLAVVNRVASKGEVKAYIAAFIGA
jgi:hypothetical protein